MVQQTPTWFGIGLLVMLAIGMAFLALIVVVTVLVASSRSGTFGRQIRAVGVALLLVLPALAVVGLVGAWFTSVRVVSSQSLETTTRSAEFDARQSIVTRHEHLDHRVPPLENAPDGFVSEGNVTRPAGSAPVEKAVTVVTPVSQAASDQPTAAQNSDGSSSEQSPQAPSVAPAAPSPPAPPAADGRQKPTIETQEAAAILSGIDLSIPPPGLLRVHETLPREPAWATTGPIPSDQGVLVSISSQRFATLAEAEQQVTQLALGYVKDFYRKEYPLSGDWNVPVAAIEQHAVNALVGEEFDQDFGNGITGKMYRAHLRLDLNARLRQTLHASWHDQIVMQRLTRLGTGLGMVTVLLAAAAGYFRLNDMTQGQYRGRLKLAAAALVGAAGLGVLAIG